MLVWVASYPRSGNHLVMLTLRDVFGVRRHGEIVSEDLGLGRLPELPPSPAVAPWRPPPELLGLSQADLLDALRARPEPFFIKTHRPAQADTSDPALYLVRDGRDALVSQAHRVEATGQPEFRGQPYNRRLAVLIRRGRRGFGDWSRHVRTWRRRDAPTSVIRYEELIRRPGEVVGDACRRLGVELPNPSGEPMSFESARERMPVEFRRGVVGAWRDEMPPRLERTFWRVHGEEMEALGYPR